MNTTTKPKPKSARPSLIAPQVLSDEGRAQVVVQMLGQLQSQRLHLEVQQVVNDHGLDTAMPAAPGESPDADPVTYAERFQQLTEAEDRLCAAYEDVVPTIHEMVSRTATDPSEG